MVAHVSSDTMTDDQAGGKVRKKSKGSNHISCQVSCLDGSIIKAEIDKTAQGEELFKKVVNDLSITEKECVGLHFNNEKGVKIWLDIHKEMKHQLGDLEDISFEFRFKFYEPEPSRIKDVFLRYLFYLQLREDIIEGKMKPTAEHTYAQLGSYTVQADLGDFNLHSMDHNYLNDYVFAPKEINSSNLAKKVHELHKEVRGLSPTQAEINFLEIAKKIPRYGVDVHNAKDNEGNLEIGVAAVGIYVYRLSRKEYLFKWQVIDAVLYNRRKYTIKIKEGVPKAGETEDEVKAKKRPQLTFIYYFDSATKCKQCYKSSVEHHTFFRLARPDTPRKKVDSLKLGSSFRYSDKTLYQLRHRSNQEGSPAQEVSFTRTPSTKPRSTNTPRDSWNPDEEHKVRDITPVENGSHLPLVDEEPQYEEIEIDESSPEDAKFDPQEWEIVEKPQPDGSVKRFRRRVIVPVKKRKYDEGQPDKDIDIPVQKEIISPKSRKMELVQEEAMMEESVAFPESGAPIDFGMEEVEIDENNPEDSWYDPTEWDVVERTMPDGTKKRYRVRLISAATIPTSPHSIQDVTREEAAAEPFPCWTTLKPLPAVPSNLFVEEPVMQIEQVDMDEAYPEVFDPNEWQIAEVLLPDGKTKEVRRRIVVMRINVVPRKPSELEPDELVGVLEEIALDEYHPEDVEDSLSWEVAEKVLPNGEKQVVRRRVVVNRLKFITKKPCEIPKDEPLAIVEEVELDPANPEPFDPNEWEVIEKELPDGTIKPIRRRVCVNLLQYVPKPQDEVDQNFSHVTLEEVDVEEGDEDQYDPLEWDLVEKKLPNEEVVPVHRRLVVARYQVYNKKPSEVDPNEPLVEIEEVEMGIDPNADEDIDLNEWDMEDVVQPDGTVKRMRRRLITTRVEYVYKKPFDVTIDEKPVAELDENYVNPDEPDDKDYNPDEWEVEEKIMPGGERVQVRRRCVIRRVHITFSKPSEVQPEQRRMRIEEVDITDEDPHDAVFDSKKWEMVEKTSPGCMGKVKRVLRRIVVSDMNVTHEKPSEVSDEIGEALKEIDHNTDVVWKDSDIMIGEKVVNGRQTFLVPEVTSVHRKLSEVPTHYQLATMEEKDLSAMELEDELFVPNDWEIAEKILPDGTTVPVYRRYQLKTHTKEYMKPCDVDADVPVVVIEEAEIQPHHIEDDKCDPLDGWEIIDKELPDGSVTKVQHRHLLVSKEHTYLKPDDVIKEVPRIEVEEVLMNEEKPEEDKYDPDEWDIIDKISPAGDRKRYRIRIKVTRVAKVHFKPSEIVPHIGEELEVEELEIDEPLPADNTDEWEVVEKNLPDGTKKQVRQRHTAISVEVLYAKPTDSNEDLGVAVEELPLTVDEKPNIDYDPAEWEILEKESPSGEKKRFRYRIIIRAPSSHKGVERPIETAVPSVPRPALVEDDIICAVEQPVAHSAPTDDFIFLDVTPVPEEKKGKKVFRRRSIKTKITPVGGRSVSVSTEEVPKQTEEIEIDENDPQDDKYDPKEWEVIEKIMPDNSVKKYRRRKFETVITTVNKRYNEAMVDGAPMQLEEYEIDEAHPENISLDPSECEILEKTLPDGSCKRYSRRIVASALPSGGKEPDTPELWEEVEIDESNPEDEKYDTDEWEVLERTLTDGSTKRFRRRNLNVVTVHKKPIAITAGDVPLRVQDVEVEEDMEEGSVNLDDWEVVEKTLPDGRKKKFYRKILTTIFSSLDDKNEMIENPPIHIEEEEIYEVSSDDDDAFSPNEWEIIDKIQPDGSITKVRTRSSVTVITPKNTMKLEDKTVEETPVVAEEIELDESSPHGHLDPEEWDIIEKKMPDGTTKRFHRRIIRKYKKVASHEHLDNVDAPEPVAETPVEEFEIDESNLEELQKYNTPEWEIVEKKMPDGSVKRYRRKIITTVVTTVTTKTIVVHPDGREEIVDIETTPGEQTTLETFGDLETITQNLKTKTQHEEEIILPVDAGNVEAGADMNFDVDGILSEIDQISKSLSEDEKREARQKIEIHKKKKENIDFPEEFEIDTTGMSEEELKQMREEEAQRILDHNATISSIFSINDDEYKSPLRPLRSHDCAECDEDESLEFASADVDFSFSDDAAVVRTASVREQQKIDKFDRPKRHSSGDDPRVRSLDKRYLKRGETEPVPRPYSSAGGDQHDVYRSHDDTGAEIIYTLRDVSEVEQGQGGFVQSIKQRHDKIAHDQLEEIIHDAEYPDKCILPPKGHVPTHRVSYSSVKEPDVMVTNDPPTVTGTPTVIIPASSELPDEEVTFQTSHPSVESHPDLLAEISDVEIPEVKTQSVIFEEKPEEDVLVNDPALETLSVQIVPISETYTTLESGEPNSNTITTYTMPTEVITKTITCEGDPSMMTPEELQEIIRRAGTDDDMLDVDTSSTHVVTTTTVQKVITGEMVGEDDVELQKVISEAVSSATHDSEELDDGTVVLTVVQQYDEDGNVINTDVVDATNAMDKIVGDGTEI